ncbi:MAG: ABC transporter substrate-binding protein [Thermotogota bacterium]
MKKLLVFLMVSVFAFAAFAEVMNPDTINHVTFGDADTLDPHYAYDTSSNEIIWNVYDALIAYDGESINDFVPMLSTNVPSEEEGTIINDGKTYVFKIRDGVKFHNGNDLTPEDIEYTIERGIIFGSSAGPAYMFVSKITGHSYVTDFFEAVTGVEWAEAVDEEGNAVSEHKETLMNFYKEEIDPRVEVKGDEVHVHLVEPSASFLYIMSHAGGWASMMDKEWMTETGAWNGEADGWWKYQDPQKEDSPIYEVAMGTGPYKLVSWDKAQQRIVLERYEDYWRGSAPIKDVVRMGVDEWSTSRTMIERGEADLVAERALYYEQMIGREDEGIKVVEGLPELTTIVLNVTWTIKENSDYIYSGRLDGEGIPNDFFKDVNVRRAFQHAVDYQSLIDDLLYGHGDRLATALAAPLMGTSDEVKMPEFNLDEAEKYFRRAYRGQVWDNGFKVAVLYNVGNDVRQTVAEMLRDNLAKINPKFQVEVVGLQWPAFLDAQINKEMPAYTLGWVSDYPDPTNFLDVYYASYGYYGSSYGEDYDRYARQPNPELGGVSIDAFLKDASKELDPETRERKYVQFQKAIDEEAIVIPLYQPSGMRFMRTWIDGFIFNPIRPGYYYWELDKVE